LRSLSRVCCSGWAGSKPATASKHRKKVVEGSKEKESVNRGKLIWDATCAPADIRYPTDLGLLNQARKQTEKIIDVLYDRLEEKPANKPITQRIIAKKEYLKIAKKRRVTKKQRRKAIKKQLQYINRNLGHIEQLQLGGASLEWLSDQEHKMLLVVGTVYQQQLSMKEESELLEYH
jgi:transposase, IS5 family